MRKFLSGMSPRTFGDIGRYRNRCAPNLTGEPIALLLWKVFAVFVDRNNKFYPFGPSLKLLMWTHGCQLLSSELLTIYHSPLLQIQNGPIMVQSCLTQPPVRVNDGRVTNDREHRQVAHAVGIGVRVAKTEAFALGEHSDPGSLRGRGHHRRQQSASGDAVNKFQTVRDVVFDSEVLHQGLHRNIQRASHYNLSQAVTTRLLQQLIGSGKNRRLQDGKK